MQSFQIITYTINSTTTTTTTNAAIVAVCCLEALPDDQLSAAPCLLEIKSAKMKLLDLDDRLHYVDLW